MEKLLKKTISYATQNDFLWKLIEPISSLGSFLSNNRKLHESISLNKKLVKKYFYSMKVQNGPFIGMKYNKFESLNRTMFPKLLGTYEKELWETIEEIKDCAYSEIIDVGCAEGYYAIGLALNSSNSKIFAYDTDDKARNACRNMAALNNVSEKITIRDSLTANELKEFQFSTKGLVICDCEGFEKELFNIINVDNLHNCDLVIETHDYIDITISSNLKKLFEKTHTIKSIKSIDDIQKALTYDFEFIQHLNLYERKILLSEKRPATMEWLVCKSKNKEYT